MTDAQWQSLIILEVKDDASGLLAINVPLYWLRHADTADTELRYLLTKRDAIDLLLGSMRDAVDITAGGDSVKLSQAITNLLTLRASVELLIGRTQTGGSLTMVAASYGVAATDEFARPPWWLP